MPMDDKTARRINEMFARLPRGPWRKVKVMTTKERIVSVLKQWDLTDVSCNQLADELVSELFDDGNANEAQTPIPPDQSDMIEDAIAVLAIEFLDRAGGRANAFLENGWRCGAGLFDAAGISLR